MLATAAAAQEKKRPSPDPKKTPAPDPRTPAGATPSKRASPAPDGGVPMEDPRLTARDAVPSAQAPGVIVPGVMPPVTSTAPATRNPLPWTFALAYVQSWDDNPFFVPTPPEASWNGRIFSALTHRHRGATSEIVLDGRAEGWVVRDASRPDRLTWSGTGSGAWILSPRWNARLDESYQNAYTDESPALFRDAVLLQTTLARTNLAGGQLAYQASPRTQYSADLRHELVRFTQPTDLVGYTRMALTLAATRRTGPRSTYSASAILSDRRADGRDGRGVGGGLGMERGLGPRLFTRLNAGLQWFQTLSTGQHRVEPYGSASLEGRFHDTLLSADYAHFLTPAYEDGRDRIVDAAGLSASHRLTRWLIAFGSLGGGRRTDIDREGFRTLAFRTGIGVAAQVSRRLEARVTHIYEKSDERFPVVVRNRNRFDVSLGYRTQW